MRENNRNPIERCRKRLPQFTTMNVIDGQAGLVIYSSLIFYSLTIDNILNIIVLLILAGVTIATLTGENGILTRANDAKTETEQAEEDELRKLTQVEAATYLKEHEYTDVSGEKVTIPAQCAVSQVEGENTLEDGLVIIDKNGNEWVWIEVPKSIYENEEYYTNGATNPTSSEDYTNIEKIMQNYATKYRGSYTDEWYSEAQHGFVSPEEYNSHKNAMLKSVYENGGFYIGKYEVGSFDNPVTSNNNTRKAVIQKGAYPYNYVTCKQAQELSESLAVGGKTSSLMFGIQWDLVLAYLESKGVPEADLNDDSSSWGNYANNSFQVAEGNKYAIYNQSTSQLGDWNPVPSGYEKPNSGTENRVLLSTGAVEDNSKMNIYDLAGNVYEWTLEKSTGTDNPCASGGGGYGGNGSDNPASNRYNYSTSSSDIYLGFRPALY